MGKSIRCMECGRFTNNSSNLCDECEAEIYYPSLREKPKAKEKEHEFFEGTNVPVDERDDLSATGQI